MPEQREISFRRIRGRIVPIRVKKGRSPSRDREFNKKVKQSIAGISGGLATAAAGGFISGKKFRKSLGKQQRAFRFAMGRSTFGATQDTIFAGAMAGQRAKKSAKFSIRAAGIAQLAGGVGIGIGIDKALEALGVEDDSTISEISSQVAGAGLAKVTAKSFRRGRISPAARRRARFVRKAKVKKVGRAIKQAAKVFLRFK